MVKSRIITVAVISLLTLALLVGAVFAYYYFSERGWGQDITVVAVYMKFNNRSINYATAYDMGLLSRGDSIDVNFEVQIKSSGGGSVGGYLVEFDFMSAGEDGSVANVEYGLERAIEVYKYNGGKYEFFCMLDKLSSLSGVIPVNSSDNYYFKLVYSDTAGDYYEGKSFAVAVTAKSANVDAAQSIKYVSDKESLLNAAADTSNQGKIITLTKSITLDSDVTFNYKVGLDLNGRILELNGGNLNISYSGIPSEDYSVITNASPDAGDIVGSGRINIICPEGDLLRIENRFYERFGSMMNISVASGSFASAVAKEIKINAAEYGNRYLKSGDLIDVTEGVEAYFSKLTPAPTFEILSGADNGYLSKTDSAGAALKNGVFRVIKDGGEYSDMGFQAISNPAFDIEFMLRGTSLGDAAQYALDALPPIISGSLFFPAYDSYTKATLTFVVDESDYIDQNGVYLPSGVDSLADWKDKELLIGVIAEIDGKQSRVYKSFTLEILSAEERTQKIYDYSELFAEDIGEYQLMQLMGLADENSFTPLAQKAALIGVKAEVATIDGTSDYLQIENDADGYVQTVRVIRRPEAELKEDVPLKLTFVYQKNEGAQEIEYTFEKNFSISGYSADEKNNDPTYFLQQGFNENLYVDGTSFYFDGRGVTENGAFVEYVIDPAYARYLMTENCVLSAATSGSRFYQLIQSDNNFTLGTAENVSDFDIGDLVFFSEFYEKTTDGTGADVYTLSENGTYVLYTDQNGAEHYLDTSGCTGYTATSKFYVAAANVPSHDITVPFTAKLFGYEKDQDGQSVKTYFKDENGDDLEYGMSLYIKGIYHNIPSEIANKRLYDVLLSLYDFNGNGYIEVTEAQTEWSDCVAAWVSAAPDSAMGQAYATYVKNESGYGGHQYIDLSSLGITEDNGGIKGLEYFTHLRGANLSGNDIIDLSPLSRLTGLEYLNLEGNDVINIEALSYLDSLEYINLQDNGLTDIEALRYLPSVKYLNLRNNDAVPSYDALESYTHLEYLNIVGYGVSQSEAYYTLSLLKAAMGDSVHLYAVNETSEYTPDDGTKAAALAMSELLVIDEAYTTLHVPDTYTYNGRTYNVVWTSLSPQYLDFPASGGYRITSPAVDTEIGIAITVTHGGSTFTLQRRFYINLLKSVGELIYVQTGDSEVQNAETLIPDKALLQALFATFNTASTQAFLGYEGTRVITWEEMEGFSGSTISLANRGITDLTGLSSFQRAVSVSGKDMTIDLTGNVFADPDAALTELSKMHGLSGLVLSAQHFDFTFLSDYTGNAAPGAIPGADASKLTSLKSLDVTGCFDLADDEVLTALYKVYMANPELSIYKDNSTTAWDPYVVPLAKYMTTLPQQFALDSYGEYVNYYTGEYLDVHPSTEGAGYVSFTFYDVNIVEMRFAKDAFGNIAGVIQASQTYVGGETFAASLQNTAEGIYLKRLVGFNTAAYQRVTLEGLDARTPDSSISGSYSVKLVLEAYRKVYISDSGMDLSFIEQFTGRTLRQAVLQMLSDTVFCLEPESDKSLIASLGGYYYDDATKSYYISRKTLADLIFPSSFALDGAYTDGGSVVGGMRYLTGLTSVFLERDADLGDGSELVNLESLSVRYSSLDLTKLTTNLPNLKTLDFSRNTGAAANNYLLRLGSGEFFRYMPNLESLYMLNSRVYNWDFLQGLADLGTNSLANLQIYQTNHSYTNYNATLYESIIKTIYTNSSAVRKNYLIGTLADPLNSTTAYTPESFAAISGILELPDGNGSAEFNEFKDHILDLGVKIKSSASGTERLYAYGGSQLLSSGGTLTLPTSSFELFFGSDFFGEEADTGIAKYFSRNFGISWRVYGVSAANLSSVFTITNGNIGTSSTGAYYSTTLTAATQGDPILLTANAPTYDYYMIFEGTLNYNNGASTGNSFIYPVLVEGSTRPTNGVYTAGGATYLSYSVFTDNALRLAMFSIAQNISVNYSNSAATAGCIRYDGTRGFASITSFTFNISVVRTATVSSLAVGFGTDNVTARPGFTPAYNATYRTSGYNYNTMYGKVTSLNGFEKLSSLNTISISRNMLMDISALEQLTNLQSVTIIDCLLSELPDLSGCVGLTTLNVSNNVIKGLVWSNGTNALSGLTSLTTLDLSGNPSIDANDLFKFSNTESVEDESWGLAALTSLNSLKLSDTSCAYDARVLKGLQTLLGKTTSSSFALTCTDLATYSGAASTLLSNINALLTYLDSPLNVNDPISVAFDSGITLDSNASTSLPNSFPQGTVSVTGGSATLDLFDSYVAIDKNDFSNVHGAIGDTEMNVKLTFTAEGTSFTIVRSVQLKDTTVTTPSIYVSNTATPTSVGQLVPKSYFSPQIWAYIVNASTPTVGGQKLRQVTIGTEDYSFVYFAANTITYTAGGVTAAAPLSLRGLNKLGITSLAVVSAYISEGFIPLDGEAQATASTTLRGDFILKKCVSDSATVNSMLSNIAASTINRVFIASCYGLDFSDNDWALRKTLAGKNTNFLSINNCYNIFFDGSTSDITESVSLFVDNMYNNTASNAYYGNSANAGLLYVTSLPHSDIVPKSFLGTSYKAMIEFMASNSVMRSIDNSNALFGNTVQSYLPLESVASKNTLRANFLRYISNFNTAASRTNQVASESSYSAYVIYEADMGASNMSAPSTDYIIYLPAETYYYGVKYNLNWSISAYAQGLLVDVTDPANGNTYKALSFQNYIDNNTDYQTLRDALGAGSRDYRFVLTVVGTPVSAQAHDGTGFTRDSISTSFNYKLVVNDVIDDNVRRDYFVELPDGVTGELKYYPAEDYFKSGRLLYELFNNTSSVIGNAAYVQMGDIVNAKTGQAYSGVYYLTYEGQRNAVSFTVNNSAVSSFKGMELFQNIRSVTLYSAGTLATEYKYFANYKLNSFNFGFSGDNIVRSPLDDWSFLYNSRDTLTTFSYSTRADMQIEEFNFLLAFNNLARVTIRYSTSDLASYHDMRACNQLATRMLKVAPSLVLFNVNEISYLDYADADEIKADDIFEAMDFLGSSVTLSNGFRLAINDGITDLNGSYTLLIPAYIDCGGDIYPIDWRPVEEHSLVGNVLYTGAEFTVALDSAGSINIKNGDYIDYDTFRQLADTAEFIRITSLGLGDFHREITVSDYALNTKNAFYFLARVTVTERNQYRHILSEHTFDRMYSITDIDTPEMLRIIMPEGITSMFLPCFGGGSWSIVAGEGETGLSITELTVSGVPAYYLTVTDSALAKQSGARLSFTPSNLSNTDAFECPVYFSILSISEYQALYKGYIESMKAFYSSDSRYTAENLAIIERVLNEALAEIEAATEMSVIQTAYSSIFINSEFMQATLLYMVQFKLDSSSDVEFANQVWVNGDSYTLPLKDSAIINTAVLDITNPDFIGWLVNGTAYDFGAAITLSGDITLTPRFRLTNSYTIEYTANVTEGSRTTTINDSFTVKYYSDGVVYNGTTYYYVAEHMQIALKDSNNSLTADIKNAATGASALADATAFTALFTADSNELTNGNAFGNSSSSSNRFSLYGNFTVYFNVDDSGNVTAFAAHRDTHVFSILGLACGGWQPRVNFNRLLRYDPDSGLYYITYSFTANNIKVGAYIRGSISDAAYNTSNYSRFALIHSGLRTESGSDPVLASAGTYTLYFTPNYSGYTSGTISVREANIKLGDALNNGFTYSSSSIVFGGASSGNYGFIFINGDYNATKALADTAFANANRSA